MNKLLARPQSRRGVALVITLSMLVLLTVLVVGFTVNMRTEHQAAAAMTGAARAELVAQSALAHAVSILSANIPQPVPPIQPGMQTPTPVNWMVNPGLLTTIQGQLDENGGAGKVIVRKIPLSSNPPDAGNVPYASTAADANLNPPLLNGGHAILPGSEEMRVAWVPVLQYPGQAAGAANPIVGRYAFWMDDENAKINLNTAGGKPAGMDFAKLTPGYNTVGTVQYPLGHPSSLNLDVLGGVDVAGLAAAVGSSGGLKSIDAIKPFVSSGDPAAFLEANKFNLTAWSRDPEFNVFGKSRLFSVRGVVPPGQLGVNEPMFQFFRDKDAPIYVPSDENENYPNDTPGDAFSLYHTAAGISAFLARTNWPGMPAKSFVDKWSKDANGTPIASDYVGAVGDREADQFAWNLPTMEHFAAGSSNGTTESTRWTDYTNLRNRTVPGQIGSTGSANQPNSSAELGGQSGKAMLPAYPGPMVDEVCLVISPELISGNKYRLKVSARYELWLPPGYTKCDMSGTSNNITIGLTHLAYSVTQGDPPAVIQEAKQEDVKYRDRTFIADDDTKAPNGIKVLYASYNSSMDPAVGPDGDFEPVIPPPNLYPDDPTKANNFFYVRNGKGFNPSPVGAAPFLAAGGKIQCQFRMRLYTGCYSGFPPNDLPATRQLIPVWDSHDPGTEVQQPQTWQKYLAKTNLQAFKPPLDDQDDFIKLNFDLDPAQFSPGQVYTRSIEVADPRLSGRARAWKMVNVPDPSTLKADTINRINDLTVAENVDLKKLAFLDFKQPGDTPSSRPPSTGMISLLPTGMQRGIPGATVKLQPSPNNSDLPDWLLLDLVAPTPSAANLGGLTLMNSTVGKINVNGKIYPSTGSFSPPQRWKPLQALFENMPGVEASGNAPSAVVSNILGYNFAGQAFGVPGAYDYAGKICEVSGVADSGATDWDKEVLVRNLASSLTTRTNVFSVWGVAQAIKKKPGNAQPGVYETGDAVTGEKRFQAIVERYVWPGRDNTPGNGYVAAPGGAYARTAPGRQPGQAPPYGGGDWEKLDGPDLPTYPPPGSSPGPWTRSAAAAYTSSTLENADNPVRALMKYRVISYRYLND